MKSSQNINSRTRIRSSLQNLLTSSESVHLFAKMIPLLLVLVAGLIQNPFSGFMLQLRGAEP